MNLESSMALLAQHAQAISQLARHVSPEQARWKPAPESWSLLEVVNHLYDEEREDFRVRLKHILDHAPGLPPAIDPQGWVTARRYAERDLPNSLEQFMQEREVSLDWLRTLAAPDWEAGIEAPFGRITAGDMLASWVAHDLLHLRQIIELRYACHQAAAQPYHIAYAGDW
jgi:hypothetical protein